MARVEIQNTVKNVLAMVALNTNYNTNMLEGRPSVNHSKNKS